MNKRNFLCLVMLSTFLWHGGFAECMELTENSGSSNKAGTTVTLSQSSDKHQSQGDNAKYKLEGLQNYVDNILQLLCKKNVPWGEVDYGNIEDSAEILALISSLKNFGRNNYAAASASLQLASDLIKNQRISLQRIDPDEDPIVHKAATSMYGQMDALVQATSADLESKIGVSIAVNVRGDLQFTKISKK